MAILNRAISNARAMMRASEWGDSSIPPNSRAASSLGGPSGVEAGALAIGTVLACVKVLHDDVTVLPFNAYVGDPNGPRKVNPVQPQIVTEPFGPDLSPGAGFGQITVSKAMRGNAYLYVTSRDPNSGCPTQLAVLHPDMVTPRRETSGPNKGQKFFQVGGDKFGTADIVHITGLMPPGAIAGVDVITAQRINLDLAMKVGAYADGFFGGGGSPAGVISVKGPGDRKKARAVKDAWEAGHAGVLNAHRPAVLFGDATWTPMSVTPENAQFLQTRRYLREELCGLFGVPLQRIQAIVENASQGGGKGLDAIDHGYVTHTLLAHFTGIESAWNRMLPGGARTWTSFNVDGFLRAAAKERAEIGQLHRLGGIRTRDEIRADEGWEPLANGLGADPNAPLNSNVAPPAPDSPADSGGPA